MKIIFSSKRTRYYSLKIFPLHVLIIPPYYDIGYSYTRVDTLDGSVCFKSIELFKPSNHYAKITYKTARKLLGSKHLKEILKTDKIKIKTL